MSGPREAADGKGAVGLIEAVGLLAAVQALDASLKSAEVSLLNLENARGSGRMVIKLTGDVGAVSAAVEAGIRAVEQIGGEVYASRVLPSPSEEVRSRFFAPDRNQAEAEQPEAPVAEAGASQEAPFEELSLQAGDSGAAKELCNLCGDPACGRRIGEVRKKCIHYPSIQQKNRRNL